MVTEKMYDKLAQLVVRKGVNVQKDQPLVIRAHVQDAAFVKKIVKCAYEAGARYVSVEWHGERRVARQRHHEDGLRVREQRSAVPGAAVEI